MLPRLHQQGICGRALARAKQQRPDSRSASPGKVAWQSEGAIASAAGSEAPSRYASLKVLETCSVVPQDQLPVRQ